MIRYDENGNPMPVQELSCTYVFPPSIVEPDQSLSVREIYSRWKKGKSTSVHPFTADFDENADDIDYEDSENPIDRTQVENDVENARNRVDYEKQDARLKKKEKKSKAEELKSIIREATKSDDKV